MNTVHDTPPLLHTGGKHYHALLESSRAIPWELDLSSWCFSFVGKRAEDFFGYAVEEWYQPGFWQKHIHPDDLDWAVNYCQTLTNRLQDHEFEYRFITKDNNIAWIREHVVVICDEQNKPTHLVGYMFDITDKKEHEEALKKNQQYLEEIQSLAQIGIWDWNLLNGEIFWSDEVFYISGAKPGDFKPDMDKVKSLIHPEDQDRVFAAVKQALIKNNYSIDYRFLLANGDIKAIHSQARVEYNSDGKPVRMLGTIQDITERKRLESALQSLSDFDSQYITKDYFDRIVQDLVKIYQADFAFIGLFSDEQKNAIQIQSIIMNGQLAEPFCYKLEGTPCDDIVHCRKELIAERVYQQYPKDEMLVKLKIETYFGIPIKLSNGDVVGLVSIMNRSPLKITAWTESVLQLFARKISGYIEFKHAQEQIKRSEEDLKNILKSMQDTFYRIDNEGMILQLSDSVKTLLGYSKKEMLGKAMLDYCAEPEKANKLFDFLQQQNGILEDIEIALKHKSGALVWVSCNAHFYTDAFGTIQGVEGMIKNITPQHDARIQMAKMSSALEHSGDMVMITDAMGTIEYVNPKFEEITGYSLTEVIGKYSNRLKSGEHGVEFYTRLWQTIRSGNTFKAVFTNKTKAGKLYFEEKVITPIKNAEGVITNYVSTGRDITENIRNHQRLEFMAHHDALTKLPNRSFLMEELKNVIKQAEQKNGKLAVLFIDMDRFKNINDTLGHEIGDLFLVNLAERLRKVIRNEDIVARLGGDEFAVVIKGIDSKKTISRITEKLIAELAEPYIIQNHELIVTASIGISLYPEHGKECSVLIKNADLAMYRAKEQGKNNYQFYASNMGKTVQRKLVIEHDLRNALVNDEFVLYYQPQIDITTGQIIGAEALVRWQHPEKGLIPPNDFIPILEETGLIVDVGAWIFATACKQIKKWQNAGLDKLTISINISAKQFHDPGFIDLVQKQIKRYQLEPETVEMEITESVLMEDQSHTIKSLDCFDKLGFKMALDDFGTGYSSLSYLRRFKIDTLKVDQSFIRHVTDDKDDAAITAAIIAMAQSLNLKIIAEGVETKEQLEFLKEKKTVFVQGYLYSKPLPANELTSILSKNRGVFLLE